MKNSETTERKYIPVEECVEGHVYRIFSRNLSFGVFVRTKDSDGFIGIREKGHSLYLFREFHADTGGQFGTVRPLEDLGPLTDPKIRLAESMPSTCQYCGERCEYVKVEGGVQKGDQNYPGEWRHLSGGDNACDNPRAEGRENYRLYNELREFEREHGDGIRSDYVWVLSVGGLDADNEPWDPTSGYTIVGSGGATDVFRTRGELMWHMNENPPKYEDNPDAEWVQPDMMEMFWYVGPLKHQLGYRWAMGRKMRLK